jgi:hypothetical protein
MSFMNLLSFFFCPDFNGLYLVQSEILDEAMERKKIEDQNLSSNNHNAIAEDNTERLNSTNQEVAVDGDQKVSVDESKKVALGNSPVVGKLEEDLRCFDISLLDKKEPGKHQVVNLTFKETIGEDLLAEIKLQRTDNSATPSSDTVLVLRNCEEGQETFTPNNIHQELCIPSNNPQVKTGHPLRALWHWISCTTKSQTESPLPLVEETSSIFRWDTEDIINLLLVLIFNGAIIGIVGGISNFRRGQSTLAQRAWTMLWLIIGLSWMIIDMLIDHISAYLEIKELYHEAFSIIVTVTLIAPAVGGFVVVGQMLRTYGTCTVLS